MNLLDWSKRTNEKALTPVDPRGGFWGWLGGVVREAWPGAWQQNVEVTVDNVTKYYAVYACVTLIASDIAKNRLKLVRFDGDIESGIWIETENPAFSPVLRKPNHYQNRIKFVEWWIVSKLLHGNTYALKRRDQRRVVTGLYILDPCRVRVLVSPIGDVFYALRFDNLSAMALAQQIPLQGLTEVDGVREGELVVPAAEIIHDVMTPLFHPLVGVSPIFACGFAALQGLKIQANSYKFFANFSQPGGIILAPGAIDAAAAERIKTYWDANFTGDNVGKVAILGDNLKYEAVGMINAADAQLIEQLKWTCEAICACFHVPPYMIGCGPMPSYNNVQALNLQYYNQALQNPIESLEISLDEGLGLAPGRIDGVQYGVEMDLDGLLRMDTKTLTEVEGAKVKAGFGKPNESRRKFDLPPVPGGNTPYMQQQNYSLSALDARDRANPAPSQNQAPRQQPRAALPAGATQNAPPTQRQLESDDLAAHVDAIAKEWATAA